MRRPLGGADPGPGNVPGKASPDSRPGTGPHDGAGTGQVNAAGAVSDHGPGTKPDHEAGRRPGNGPDTQGGPAGRQEAPVVPSRWANGARTAGSEAPDAFGGPRHPGAGLARLRGWGGVAAMAVACVLTAAFTLLPLTRAADGGGTPVWGHTAADGLPALRTLGGVDGATRAQRADAAADDEDCNRSLPPSSADGPTIAAIKKKGYLVVGIDQSSYRWGYRDPNKTATDPEGFDIDLVHEIARQILGNGNAVQYRAVPTNQRVAAIQRGEVDMVVRTMTITCERAKDVAFSTGYFETGQQILAPKDSNITGYNTTLRGKRICSAEGSTALTELQKQSFGADISTTVPNQLDCLVRLQLGEVDAVVTDSALAAGQAAQDPTVELKGGTFTTEFYGVAMKKGADDLVRRVNRILEDYRRSGWQKSYDTWLRDDLGTTMAPPAPRYI